MTTAAKLVSIMKRKAIAKADLSRLTGMSPSHISRITADDGGAHQCDIATLYRLADALKVNVADVLPDRTSVLKPAGWI